MSLVPSPARTFTTARQAVRNWPIATLPPPTLLGFVLGVPALGLAAIGVATSYATFRLPDMALFLVLFLCALVALEVTRRVEEPQGTRARDFHSVWCLPIAVLLPPVYALAAPVFLMMLTQWRVRRGLVYRRVFSAAAIALAMGGASVVFHSMAGGLLGQHSSIAPYSLMWSLAVVSSGVARWLINSGLVVFAVRAADPETTLWELLTNRESMYSDLVEVSLGVLVTVVVAVHPILVLVALPSVLLQQRFVLHSQLVTQARVDVKTGVLNARTWEREATTEISRAAQSAAPLAIILADIDHFKSVNDRFGHLTGDRVLRAVASTFASKLRDYDVVGRIGGEEFAVLLPQTGSEQARDIAERLRQGVTDLAVPLNDEHDPEHLWVTVSLGAAVRDDDDNNELTSLLAAADLALYRAKDEGRDRVHVLAET